MSGRYQQAGRGLQIMFFAELLTILGAVVGIVPLLGGVAAMVILLAAGLLSLYGLLITTSAHPHYMMALYMVIAGMVCTVFTTLSDRLLGSLAAVLGGVVDFLAVYFICSATSALLREKGDHFQADQGLLIWKLYGGCIVVHLALLVLGWMPIVGFLLSVLDVVAGLARVLGGILLVIYYHTASKSLLS